MKSFGYAAMAQNGSLAPYTFPRRDPGPTDVVIDIRYCGVCHSDLNAIRNVFGFQSYPLVPGHEIVGTVVSVGTAVTKFKVGDWAGVGTIVDSCRVCIRCRSDLEPYCLEGMTPTYGFPDRRGDMAYGGFSNNYVVDEQFALRLPDALDPARVAPLLCAGITTYSPLRRANVGPGSRVGIVGLGGLGHMAVKWAHALGAHVTVFTTSPGKARDATALGADATVLSSDAKAMGAQAGQFDFILDTVSGAHDINPYLQALTFQGTMCLVGIPDSPPTVMPVLLAMGRRAVSGSMIGGIAETQEMLEFAARHGISSDIELIGIEEVDQAFTRLEKGDVRYRFVIDMASLPRAGAQA